MCPKVVIRDLDRFASFEILNVLDEEVGVETVGMVEVCFTPLFEG